MNDEDLRFRPTAALLLFCLSQFFNIPILLAWGDKTIDCVIQLDVLSNGNCLHEVAHIANGSHPGNCISLLRINVSIFPGTMIIISFVRNLNHLVMSSLPNKKLTDVFIQESDCLN